MSQSQVAGFLDLPVDGATVPLGRIRIAGWVFCTASPVSRVEIWVDGRLQGAAMLGLPRPDVVTVLGDTAGELAGFEFPLDLRRVDGLKGQIQFRVTVVLLNGERTDLSTVNIAVALPADARSADRKARLLCLARSLDHGGSQLRMRELIQYLGEKGFVSTVLSPTEGPLRSDLEVAGATVVVAPIPTDQPLQYEEAIATLSMWAADRFDVTLGFTLTSFAAVDLAERLRLPSIWRIGECETAATVVEWLGGHLHPDVERAADRAFATASVVIFNAENTLRYFRTLGHFGRFAVLGSGTDVAGAVAYRAAHTKEACRRTLGVRSDRRILLCAATLWPIKGQTLLITALERVHADFPHLECVLVGFQVREYVESLVRAVGTLGLTDVVRILPFSSDLRAWRRAADVAVSSSSQESMSGSILEAMAFGLPVLATRVGGSPEVVEQGVTGWLCEPNDLGSLIEGLRRVAIASTDTLRTLGEQAIARVSQTHDREVALSQMADLISSLTRGLRPGLLDK